MKTYSVTWQCDIDAKSPRDAAKKALEYIEDHEALVFEVDGKIVDLDENVCPLCGEDLRTVVVPDMTGKGLHEEQVCGCEL